MALAVDCDGTIALDGRVDDPTRAALESVRRTGRRLLLVTGRQLDDLRQAFDRLDLFDFVVAENGALLFEPARNEQTLLSPPIDERFVAELRRRGVRPLAVGEGIVSTWEPNEKAVLDAIRDLGLELQVIFNKGAVMVLLRVQTRPADWRRPCSGWSSRREIRSGSAMPKTTKRSCGLASSPPPSKTPFQRSRNRLIS